MRKRKHKRSFALLLSAALLIGQPGATANAEEPPNAGNLCEHHRAHDDACGYKEKGREGSLGGVEAAEGHACQHEHGAECYTDQLICGYGDGDVETASGSVAGHRHGQECYKPDCPHEHGEHDTTCGYIEGGKGTPCGYVCNQCGREQDKDTGTTGGNNPPAPVKATTVTVEPKDAGTITVTAFDQLGGGVKVQTVRKGTKLESLTLPATLGAFGYTAADHMETVPEPEAITIEGVRWELTGEKGTPTVYEDGRISPCNYYFQPVLPESYSLAGGATLPKIQVRYGWATRANTSSYNTKDEATFKQILTDHPELMSIPGVDKDDPASWATAGLVRWDWNVRPYRLTTLDLTDKGLEGTLDVSGMTALTVLYCAENKLKTLNVTGTALINLNCSDNKLTELKGLSGLSTLQTLDCDSNQLDNLNVTGTALTWLICYDNKLTELKGLSGLSTLRMLNCDSNQLDRLDVTGTALTGLDCSENKLTELKGVSGLSTLQRLGCSRNQLDKLDVTGTALTHLSCSDNKLTELKGVSGLSTLQDLNCSKNQLDKLDVTGTALTGLLCSDNKLTELKGVPGLSTLQTLTCYKNQLGKLDVAGTALTYLSCSDNKLTELKGVSGLSTLISLICDKNQLDRLDVTGTALFPFSLSCTENPLTLFTTKDGHTLTVEAGAGGKAYMTSYSVSTNRAELTATPHSGHTFKAWTNLPAGAANTQTTSFELSDTIRVSAVFDSSHNDDSENYTITTPQLPKPNTPVLAVIELPVTVENGAAAGKPDDGPTATAIAQAQRDSKAKTNGIAVRYDAKTLETYNGFFIVIERVTLDRLIESKVKWMAVNTGIVDLTFDLAALQEIAAKSTGDVTLTATRETGLTGDALAAVGQRPAYRLAVTYTGADGKAAAVQDFGAGRVAVGLAYTPAATEQAGSLYLVYSKDGKGAEWLCQSSYKVDFAAGEREGALGHDRTGGNVISSVGHFSVYGVGCRPAPAFTDTENHWAKEDIDFAVSRGLMTGTSETTFTPNGAITRGMFVTALGRLAGIDPAAYPSSSRFVDVPADAYYTPYVEWAVGKGIVSGTGENTFSPDTAITREQMALIMERYTQQLGYTLPVAREGEIFVDEGQITGSMKEAVQAMQQAGVMNGKDGHCFGPKDAATRAEAAAVLRRFVQIVTDPAAVGGWGQNDAGRWLYYENNKPVTGWKQVESKWYYFDAAGLMQAGGWKEIDGKWYYFYMDGSMAANVKIDGHQIGPDGKRTE